MKKNILLISFLAAGLIMAAAGLANAANEKKPGNQNQQEDQGQQAREQKQIQTQEHRSAVADFVQSLERVADDKFGIGQQVRTIAQEQNQSAETTVQAMEKVQTRNRIKAFFLGSDYKNLGALRSEMVKTRNRLEQLNRLMENVGEEEKTELQNKIQAMEQEQEKIESFIKENESKFSLFGWVAKLFNK